MPFIVKQIVGRLLVAFFSVVAVLVQIIELEDDVMNLYKGITGLFCFAVAYIFVDKKTRSRAVLIGLSATALMFISFLYNSNIRPNNFAWIWSYLGVAMLLYEYGADRRLSLGIFYGFTVYFLYMAVIGGIESKEALGQNSANYISVLLIFCLSVYYVALNHSSSKEFSYLPLISILFLSAWAANRSGIICMIFVIPLVVIINRSISERTKHRFRFVLVLLFFTIAIIYLSGYVSEYMTSLTRKTEAVGMASLRSSIWREYIQGTFDSFGNLFLGVPAKLAKYPLLSRFDGNPHNTFLMLHSKFGLWGLVLIIVCIIKATIQSIRIKDYYVLIIVLMIVIRGFFDWTAFPGLFDVIYYYIIFYVIDNNKQIV